MAMAYRSTKAFACYLSRLGREEKDAALRALDREAERIRAMAPGAHRARAVHTGVDEAQARFAALKPEVIAQVRCGKGCAHCCRLWVGVTLDEAELLAERVRAGTARPDPLRLEAQSGWATPAEFLGKPREEASCVFLGPDGACTVYEDRPSICRSVLVASDPELCRRGDESTRITAVLNPYADVIVSAALTVDAEGEPPPADGRHLATALHAALAKLPHDRM